MMRKFLTLILVCASMAAGAVVQAADGKANAGKPGVTEGEFAKWLVNVLGLSRSLPAAPSDKECFAALLQNGIAPKNGWNATNLVTMASLSRVIVQSMHKQGEVKNPQDDKSWIEYLKTSHVEFATVTEALSQVGPLDPAIHGDAIVTSTDPLKKLARFRPSDEELLGTDKGTIGRVFLTGGPIPPVTPN